MALSTKHKASRTTTTQDNNNNNNSNNVIKRNCCCWCCYPPKPQSNNTNTSNNSNNAICNIIDIINDNHLNTFYDNNTSLNGDDSKFKHNIDQLNLKFYLETEKILSSPHPTSNEQLEHQNKLFLILFKQINLYIKEIERLNMLLIRDTTGNAEGMRKRMEIITKQKDNFETKEMLIQSLKHSVESLEQKLLKCIISENALREENEKLKQELKLYKHNNNDSPCHSSKHNLTTSKTRTYSSDHQHTQHVNVMMMYNECNKECKLLSQHLSSRSPNTNKNVNKKILNFNLNNKSSSSTSGKVFYNGSACNSNSNSNKKMKIIKEAKNKFVMLNKNKSVNTFGCVTTCCSGSGSGNAGSCVVLDGLPKSPRVNNGFNIKQRLVAQHKQTSVSPTNSCSVSMNNGKGSNSNSNRNASNEKEITKIENLLVEIKDHYNNNNNDNTSLIYNNNNNEHYHNHHQHNVQYTTTTKHNYTPDNDIEQHQQQQQQQTYFQYTHSPLQGRAISNGGAYG